MTAPRRARHAQARPSVRIDVAGCATPTPSRHSQRLHVNRKRPNAAEMPQIEQRISSSQNEATRPPNAAATGLLMRQACQWVRAATAVSGKCLRTRAQPRR